MNIELLLSALVMLGPLLASIGKVAEALNNGEEPDQSDLDNLKEARHLSDSRLFDKLKEAAKDVS